MVKYYLKHAGRSVLSDIKREAQPSVLYLIKHDYTSALNGLKTDSSYMSSLAK